MGAPDGNEVDEVGDGEGEERDGEGEVAARPYQLRRGGGGGRGRSGALCRGQHLAAPHGRGWLPSSRPSVASVGARAGAVVSRVWLALGLFAFCVNQKLLCRMS
jgi:hypothetical protein